MKLVDIKPAVTSSDGKTITQVVVYGDEVLWTMVAEPSPTGIGWIASIKNKTDTIWTDTKSYKSKEEAHSACISYFAFSLQTLTIVSKVHSVRQMCGVMDQDCDVSRFL